MCSGGVWLVVKRGRSAVETLTVDEQNRFCQAWPLAAQRQLQPAAEEATGRSRRPRS